MARKAKKMSTAGRRKGSRASAKKSAARPAKRKPSQGSAKKTRATPALALAQQWQERVTELHEQARTLHKEWKKSSIKPPSAHRKALTTLNKDLRKTARAIKKLAGYKGK